MMYIDHSGTVQTMVKGKKSIVILAALSAILAVLVCVLLVRIATISHDSRMIDGRPINKNDVTITQHIAAPDGMHYVNVYTDQGSGATVASSAYVSVTAVEQAKDGKESGNGFRISHTDGQFWTFSGWTTRHF